jgi:uncharacterized membrane protein SpoIIM required for sporulation
VELGDVVKSASRAALLPEQQVTDLAFWLPYSAACFLLVAAVGVLIERHFCFAHRKDVRLVLDALSAQGVFELYAYEIADATGLSLPGRLLPRMERRGLITSRLEARNWRCASEASRLRMYRRVT